jgi:hypothetical protein
VHVSYGPRLLRVPSRTVREFIEFLGTSRLLPNLLQFSAIPEVRSMSCPYGADHVSDEARPTLDHVSWLRPLASVGAEKTSAVPEIWPRCYLMRARGMLLDFRIPVNGGVP